MKLSIVIPCYNEEGNIGILRGRIAELQEFHDIEFVLVDNGSSDGTSAMIDEAAAKYENIRKAVVVKNKGYGYGIKHGISECSGDYIGWTHADAQVDPRDVLKAYECIRENSSQKIFYKGNRETAQRSLSERFLTFMMGKIVSHILGVRMLDINGQPNVYPNEMRDTILNAPDDVMIEIYCYYMALKQGLKEERGTVMFGKRNAGMSKLAPSLRARLKTGIATIKYSMRLKKDIDSAVNK